jgi:hypothetical protein
MSGNRDIRKSMRLAGVEPEFKGLERQRAPVNYAAIEQVKADARAEILRRANLAAARYEARYYG